MKPKCFSSSVGYKGQAADLAGDFAPLAAAGGKSSACKGPGLLIWQQIFGCLGKDQEAAFVCER